MLDRSIRGCIAGEGGIGSNCYHGARGRCQWCGFNVYVHELRVKKLREEGLTTLKNGLKGLKLASWEIVS